MSDTKEYKTSEDFAVVYEGAGKFWKYSVSSGDNIAVCLCDLDAGQFDDIMRNLPANSSNVKVSFIKPDSSEGVMTAECIFKKAFDNTSSGQYLKIELHYSDEALEIVKSMVGQKYDIVMMMGEAVEKVKVKGEYGPVAQIICASPLFYQRKVWSMLGTEDNYLEWVRDQKCLVTGKFDVDSEARNRCEAAHCRDLRFGGGTALKPEYMAVPLRKSVHAAQHEKGVTHIWDKNGSPVSRRTRFPIQDRGDAAMQWMIISCFNHLHSWCIHQSKEVFQVPSLTMVAREQWDELLGKEYIDETLQSGKYPHEIL